MKKKTIFALFMVYISGYILLIITSLYILQIVFGVTLFDFEGMVSKQEARHQIAAYLNEKYATDVFLSKYISVKKSMEGCGCDSDPLEFVGYTAKIKEIPDAPESPKTVWMMFPENEEPFFTDDGQLDEVHQALEDYLGTNRISSDYLVLPSEYGASFHYGELTSIEWNPGKGFHAYFDGQDLTAFFDQEYSSRSAFSGPETNTYQYSIYFSIPDSEAMVSNQEFYEDMETLKNSFHLSLDAVLMKESYFSQLTDDIGKEENIISYPGAFMFSPAAYFCAYENGEWYSPTFLELIPGISLALNEKTNTELTADNFHVEKTDTPELIKTFFSKGTDNKIPDAALVDLLQTYTITCKTAEQSYEHVTLLIDLETLQFTFSDVGILQAEVSSPGISTEYFSDSVLFSNKAKTKFLKDSTLVMSTVLFPGTENMTITICPDEYLEEGTLWLLP